MSARHMLALVKAAPQPGLSLERVPVPSPDVDEVLIRVTTSAICGTDLHIYNWDEWAAQTVPVPLVVGHEYCGVIEEVGAAVRAFAPGERVSGEGHIVCGLCRNCRAGRRHLCRNTRGVGINRPGAFASYVVIPARNICPLPDDIDDETGAILDPLGNAVHTALSFDVVGEDVLITGAGPIGLMATAIVRHAGARHVVVTDINETRLAFAEKMGASRGVNAKTGDLRNVMGDLGMREGFDVGLEMSGSPAAFHDMIATMNHGGKMALLGIPSREIAVDWNEIIFKGLIVKGIYGREMFETWYKALAMLQSGLNISPVITHRIEFADYKRGFDALMSGQAGKVVMKMPPV